MCPSQFNFIQFLDKHCEEPFIPFLTLTLTKLMFLTGLRVASFCAATVAPAIINEPLRRNVGSLTSHVRAVSRASAPASSVVVCRSA